MQINWSRKQSTEVQELLSTDFSTGLSRKVAAARLKEEGRNHIFRNGIPTVWRILVNLFDDMVYLPLFFAVVMGFSYVSLWFALGTLLFFGAYLALYILLSVHAAKRISAATAASLPRIRVLRDGEVRLFDASMIVRGDVILLRAGDVVPCDAYILEAFNLEVNEGSIYPEGGIVRKSILPTDAEPFAYGAMKNMLFATSRVVGGECRAVCTAVGKHTVIVREGHDTALFGDTPPRIHREIKAFGKRLTVPLAILSVPLLALGFIYGDGLVFKTFFTAATLFGSLLPSSAEGLARIFYAVELDRLLKKKKGAALLKNPLCPDVLPSLQCLIIDTDAFFDDSSLSVFFANTDGDAPENEEDRRFFHENAYLLESCSYGEMQGEMRQKSPLSPEKNALLTYLKEVGTEASKTVRVLSYRSHDIAFSFDSVLIRTEEGDFVVSRGDAAEILRSSTERRKNGQPLPIDNDTRTRLADYIRQVGRGGRTVLAYAIKRVSGDLLSGETLSDATRALGRGMTFLGTVVLYKGECGSLDSFFETCRRRRIEPLIFHKGTADSARRLIQGHKWLGQARVCDGRTLPDVPDSFSSILNEHEIFADFSATQKEAFCRYLSKNRLSAGMVIRDASDVPFMRSVSTSFAVGNPREVQAGRPQSVPDAERLLSSDLVVDKQIESVTDAIDDMHRYRDGITLAVRYLLSMLGVRVLLSLVGAVLGVAALPPLPLLFLSFVLDVFLVDAILHGKKRRPKAERPVWQIRGVKKWISFFLPACLAVGTICLVAVLTLPTVPAMDRYSLSMTGVYTAVACAFFEAFYFSGASLEGKIRQRVCIGLVLLSLLFGVPYVCSVFGVTFHPVAPAAVLPALLMYVLGVRMRKQTKIKKI